MVGEMALFSTSSVRLISIELKAASGRGAIVSRNNTVKPSGICGVVVTVGVGVMLAVGVTEAVGVMDGIRVRVGVGVADGLGVLEGIGVTITATACEPNSLVTRPKKPRANPSKISLHPSLTRC